jgi:hypothetical protein
VKELPKGRLVRERAQGHQGVRIIIAMATLRGPGLHKLCTMHTLSLHSPMTGYAVIPTVPTGAGTQAQ